MSKTITLDLPDELYGILEDISAKSQKSFDEIVLEAISVLIDPLFSLNDETLQQEQTALSKFSDAQLWAVMFRNFPPRQLARYQELAEQQKEDLLTISEEEELDKLVRRADLYMLLRSQALLLLKNRGYSIHAWQKQTPQLSDD